MTMIPGPTRPRSEMIERTSLEAMSQARRAAPSRNETTRIPRAASAKRLTPSHHSWRRCTASGHPGYHRPRPLIRPLGAGAVGPRRVGWLRREDREGRDLDQGSLPQQALDDHAGRGRIAALEELAPHLRGAMVVLGGGGVVRGLHDVLEARARRLEELREPPKDLTCLPGDIPGRDEPPLLVGGRGPGDEQEVAGPDGRREGVAFRPRPRSRDDLVGWHGVSPCWRLTVSAAESAGSCPSPSSGAGRGT